MSQRVPADGAHADPSVCCQCDPGSSGQLGPVCGGHRRPNGAIVRLAVEFAFAAPRTRSAADGANTDSEPVEPAVELPSSTLVLADIPREADELAAAVPKGMNVCVGVETVSVAELVADDVPNGIRVVAVTASVAVDVATAGNRPTTPGPAVTLSVPVDVAADA